MEGVKTSAGGGGKTVIIIVGSLAAAGVLAYFLFRKPATPTPVIYTGGIAPQPANPVSSALGALGTIAGSIFTKKPASSAPPMIVSGWNAGNASFTLGTQSGTLNPMGNNSAGAATITAGTYTLSVDWDGAGYNILVMQGPTIANSIYVTGNGSFS